MSGDMPKGLNEQAVPEQLKVIIRRDAKTRDGVQAIMEAMILTGHDVIAILPPAEIAEPKEGDSQFVTYQDIRDSGYAVYGRRDSGITCIDVDAMLMQIEEASNA